LQNGGVADFQCVIAKGLAEHALFRETIAVATSAAVGGSAKKKGRPAESRPGPF
jgi:hypothetical protein